MLLSEELKFPFSEYDLVVIAVIIILVVIGFIFTMYFFSEISVILFNKEPVYHLNKDSYTKLLPLAEGMYCMEYLKKDFVPSEIYDDTGELSREFRIVLEKESRYIEQQFGLDDFDPYKTYLAKVDSKLLHKRWIKEEDYLTSMIEYMDYCMYLKQ